MIQPIEGREWFHVQQSAMARGKYTKNSKYNERDVNIDEGANSYFVALLTKNIHCEKRNAPQCGVRIPSIISKNPYRVKHTGERTLSTASFSTNTIVNRALLDEDEASIFIRQIS